MFSYIFLNPAMKLLRSMLLFELLLGLITTQQVFAYEYDPDNGEEINEVCAGCHGEFGAGGKEGEYPRLAGMPSDFIAKQLQLFRERERPNLAMVEYVDHRQMPDKDIQDISRYISLHSVENQAAPG